MRHFFALELPVPIRRRLSTLRDGSIGDVRWVPEVQLHLTLRFLGRVDPEVLEALLERARAAAGDWPSLRLALDGVHVFGTWHRPRVLWAGLTPLEALRAVAADLEDAARSVGLPAADRPFAPHVTIARPRRVDPRAIDAWRSRYADLRSEPFDAGPVVLLSSASVPGGVAYSRIAELEMSSN